MASEYNLLHWELVYRLIEKSLSRKEDIILSVVHTVLINSGYKCIEPGDSSQSERESLPDRWNEGPEYTIRYIKNGKIYVLNSLHVDDEIIISLLSRDDNKVRSVAFNISSTVVQLRGDSLSALIPDIRSVVTKIENELLESEKSVESQTDAPWQSTRRDTSAPRIPTGNPLMVNYPSSFGGGFDPERPTYPFDYGRSDLNPFGGSGGGMILDPFGGRRPRLPAMPGAGVPGGLPRGSVPPGARFEPIGPSNPDGRRGPNAPQPDPDHLPPPGYDDMFM